MAKNINQRAAGTAITRAISVADADDLASRFGQSFVDGGMFLPDLSPPPVGTELLMMFTLPTGQALSRASAKVLHARAAQSSTDRTAGMAVQFTDLDGTAQRIAAGRRQAQTPVANSAQGPQVERLRRSDHALAGRNGPVVGIDLGTTNSCVAFSENGVPRVLVTEQGYETIPSVVFINDARQVIIGQPAAEKLLLEPGRAIYGSKRFLGRPFASMEVHVFGHFFQYELAVGKGGLTAARLGNMVLPLEVASGYILWYAKRLAETNLGQGVTRAVITVPAYFGETQRQSVRDAARMAGLYVERIISEPTAAAVGYGYGRGLESTVLVYDLGGGTFDASVLRIQGDTMEVLATDGDPFLGGSDFDDRLTQHMLQHLLRSRGLDLRNDPVAVQRLRSACEQTKRALSSSENANVTVPYLSHTGSGPLHLEYNITRGVFERLTADLMDRTLGIVQQTLDRARIAASDIDDIILVGGQSRAPRLRQLLTERFGKKPSHHVHPDHAVALGAALVAETLTAPRARLVLVDVLPASVRLALSGGQTNVLLPRGQKLPASTEFVVQFADTQGKRFTVSLCRGEAETTADNQPLGRLMFPDTVLPKPPRTELHVRVQVTAEGIIEVQARGEANGAAHTVLLELGDGADNKVVEGDDLTIAAG